MGGTLLQEFGHDIVLLYFIDKVIKPRKKEKFLIVSAAEGPYIDIHFWNPKHDEFTSAYNEMNNKVSRGYYIPELQYRKRIDPETLEKIDKQYREIYTSRQWYKELSELLNQDLKKIC